MKRALVVALAVGMLAAACGTNEEATPTETGTTTAPVETTTLPVYFLRDGKVWPVARSYVDGQNLTFQALSFLANEPTRGRDNQARTVYWALRGVERQSVD